MRKPTYYTLFYADLVLIAALFILHRSFTFTMLNGEVLTGTRQVSAFFVGLLSDLWIAGLLALLTAGWHRLLAQQLAQGLAEKFRWILFTGVTFLVASHQSYVEFFGFTMMAFHLRYLYDSAFILANGQSLFSWVLVAYLGLLAFILMLQTDLGKSRPSRHDTSLFIGLLLGLVFAHNRNIQWRVQWFIPENLQMNLVERLYIQLKHAKAIEPVTDEERGRLVTLLRLPASAMDFHGILRELKANPQGPEHPIGAQLKEQWQDSLRFKRKPLLAVLLLESLRPSETGYFAPGTPSLTPHLDQLAASSIVFTNAWSTGSVTRGGQEAVFCGHISSRDTSLMRYDAVAPIHCLPDQLLKPLPLGGLVETFWYHGGNGLFDNQAGFWRKRGIKQLLTQDHFALDVPQTSWGVGDISFLKRSATELYKLRQESAADAFLGMLLTVSNHIPWDMPSDVVPWALPSHAKHPSYRTTAYSDHAIGVFVERLKQQGMWDDMLLILVTDHGNHVPPYQTLYKDRTTAVARQQSHMNLIITGGLATKALKDLELQNLRWNDLVSQVDISRMIADTMGLDEFQGMGENLFHTDRRLPVLSRLEQYLFDPASQSLLDPKQWQSRPASGDVERNILFYRAYIDYISTK